MTSQISFPGTNIGIQIGINNSVVGTADPLDQLAIAVGAPFDSYENQHQDECLQGTRTHLLAQITEWGNITESKVHSLVARDSGHG
ncbi:F-box and wd40 domain protein [Penicillium lividum]|nr:F-box and wd40 domain protein [Penicillium lividum]